MHTVDHQILPSPDEGPLRLNELRLEPLLSKGELVLDSWWRPREPAPASFVRRHWLFLVVVCLPVAVSTIYFGLIAADQYMSEARFVVRTTSQGDSANLASLMQDQKMSRASDETFAVSEYITSRDAMNALMANNHLRDVLSRPAADFIARYPNIYSRDNDEALYVHLQRFISVDVDSDSGIATLYVRAFNAQDAQDLASALLKDSESLVNQMNERYYEDALRLATKFVDEKKAEMLEVETHLSAYRNAQRVVDPNKEAAAALAGIGALVTDMMKAEAELGQQVAMAPTGPQSGPLRDKVASLRDEIAKQRQKIAGGDTSMAEELSEFDQLMLDRDLAARALQSAVSRLISARQDAERQQFYLQTIVQPNLADYPLYPWRILDSLFVAALSLCAFWTIRTLLRNVWEHQT
jgi:capsular polysaccharide transport system permease protein